VARRWRRGVGDRFLHRFHSQLLRFAAANHRGDRRSWRLAATKFRNLKYSWECSFLVAITAFLNLVFDRSAMNSKVLLISTNKSI
jgi:hypothetical protein